MNDPQLIVIIALVAMLGLVLVFFLGPMLPLFRCWMQVVLAGEQMCLDHRHTIRDARELGNQVLEEHRKARETQR